VSGASPGLVAFQLSFQVSPIILVDGVAGSMAGGMLPIISITEAINFPLGLLSGGDTPSLDNFFATYRPIPGGSLVSNAIGKYPFANQSVASNAIISQPKRISLLMTCPVRESLGYASKLATMMSLQSTLSQHCNSGGTFIVATPSYFYTSCLLLDLVDVSGPQSKQAQTQWQWNFEQPLLTQAQADAAQNSLMSKITQGTSFSSTPSWSGLSQTVGEPTSLAASSVIPAASGVAGAGTSSVGGSS